MCRQYLCLTILGLVLGLVNCAPPPNLQICKSDDSNCIKESAKKYQSMFVNGISEYGVEKLDPLKIKHINASDGNLLFTMTDVTVTGMKNCDIQKLERNVERSQISLRMLCTAALHGDYVLKGVVLVIPIEGKGKIHVDLKSALFNLVIDIVDKIGEDGKKHWNIKSFSHTFDLIEKSNVVFENLFEGNEVLGQAARQVIAENGNDVIKEIGSKAITHVVGIVVKNTKRFFNAVAIEDLSID